MTKNIESRTVMIILTTKDGIRHHEDTKTFVGNGNIPLSYRKPIIYTKIGLGQLETPPRPEFMYREYRLEREVEVPPEVRSGYDFVAYYREI